MARFARLLNVAVSAAASAAAQLPVVQLDPWGDNSVRVRIAPAGGSIVEPPLMGLLPNPPSMTSEVGHGANSGSSITVGNLLVNVDPTTAYITASRVSDGRVLFQQTGLTFGSAPSGTKAGAVSGLITFAGVNASAERIYGFGEQQDSQVAKALPFFRSIEASEYYVYNHGSQALIPWLASTLGYGILWNLPSYGYVNVSDAATGYPSSIFTNATQNLDFWLTTTPSDFDPAASNTSPLVPLLKQYADAVGHAPTMPYWTTGFIQSKDRYRNQTQLLAVAKEYVERGLPISMIVIDWFHWSHLGDWSFNPTCWPDPQAMVSQLNELGIELMVTFWPFMNTSSVNYPQFSSNGWLGINRTSNNPDMFWYCQPCEDEGGALVDATNPYVRQAVWSNFWDHYGNLGIKAVWLDETEPDRDGYTYGQWNLDAGSDYEVGAAWKKTWISTFNDGFQTEGYKPGEYFILSRSMWTGTHQYGNALWSGDLSSTFQELQLQIAAGQGAGLSGQGLWTTDIGGYNNGDPTNPQFQELIVRWFQFGAFSPVFRLHGHRDGGPASDECGGTNGDNEVWNLASDATHYAAIVAVMNLREDLRNYVADINTVHSQTGMPMMRPMFLQWPLDTGCQGADVEDQYMFGPDWLVAPVYTYQAASRSVYLPSLTAANGNANATWVYWFNQTSYGTGGSRVTLNTPITEFPLFYIQRASESVREPVK